MHIEKDKQTRIFRTFLSQSRRLQVLRMADMRLDPSKPKAILYVVIVTMGHLA
jgi:predicted NUDIX family phosphoesterase